MNPRRIQRKRTRGWRKPEGCIDVTRNSQWGNPFVVGKDGTAAECVKKYAEMMLPYTHRPPRNGMDDFLLSNANMECIAEALAGHDLMCWCGLCYAHKDGLPAGVHCPDCPPCHGNWLLNMANTVYNTSDTATASASVRGGHHLTSPDDSAA